MTTKKTTKKKPVKKAVKKKPLFNISKFNFCLYLVLGIVAIALLIGGISVKLHEGELVIEPTYQMSEEQLEPLYEGDLGEIDEDVITVDEIDGGGLFKDELNINEGESDFYYELGAIEDVDTSSPEAFKKSTMGRCIVANNYYGAQCVSLARAFWWSYAGFDVSTCGTGLAKGMMNCSEENAKDKFKVIWNTDEIQAGSWLVFDGTTTGHICMALGSARNGYVSCLGENQGGRICGGGIGGSATNIINISLKNFIGGYTPKDYIVPEPEPVPQPAPAVPDTSRVK